MINDEAHHNISDYEKFTFMEAILLRREVGRLAELLLHPALDEEGDGRVDSGGSVVRKVEEAYSAHGPYAGPLHAINTPADGNDVTGARSGGNIGAGICAGENTGAETGAGEPV